MSTEDKSRRGFLSSWWLRIVLILVVLGGGIALVVLYASDKPDVARTRPLQARLELAAGDVRVEQADAKGPAFSGLALLPGSEVSTGKGARALVRLSDGSALFMRDESSVRIDAEAIDLVRGEIWLDAPPTEREAAVQRIGPVSVFAADAGLSIRKSAEGSVIYAARGEVTVTAPKGRVEIQAGEQATVGSSGTPEVVPVAFWEDWTGGMADSHVVGAMAGSGAGQIYGVDRQAPGLPARVLETSRMAVRAVIRDGLAETLVDQTFFNAESRPLEGWYWFKVPAGASVTGFAVETNGVLVDGEFIERREAAAQYERAVHTGHAPALLEWIDSRTFRARIYPVPAAGSRRVVLRYLQMLPLRGDTLRYVYPMQSANPARIGEFSLVVDLGPEGEEMEITTLAGARVEARGQRVTMRRSGYTPRADFMLEARRTDAGAPMRVYRMSAGGESADYVMVRYAPDFDFDKVEGLQGEVVVVVDTSAASDESGRAVKASTAEAILRALSAGDRFALVSLDVAPVVLYPTEGLAPASEDEIGKALTRLSEHASGGATDLAALFDVSLARLHGAEQPAVIYVGDGVATSGEMEGQRLAERLRRALSTSRARFFTVGVGPDANRGLLQNLAAAGGGQAFYVDTNSAATERALSLVAALKTPTLTDFDMDLGAGLDEVFMSANGKVTSGEQVIVLARSHHDLPGRIKVKGRLGGKEVEREYSLSRERSVLASFVPRLWAAAYLQRLLGSASDPEQHRGKAMQLGITYGLMTPYTSILALESEQAYMQQGIPRRQSGLRGLRLTELSPRAGPASELAALGLAPLGLGCAKFESEPGLQSAPPSPVSVSGIEEERVAYPAAGSPQAVGGAPASTAEGAKYADKARRMAKRPRPGMAKTEMEAAPPADDMASGKGGAVEGMLASRPAPRRPSQVLQACSDAARRGLRERVILWRKRIRTAGNAQELIERYQTARQACELPDWRSEATFLRAMQPAIRDAGTASYVLRYFSSRPDVQRYLARLILRRTVDEQIVAVVEQTLFGARINWANVDIELAELKTPQERLARLGQIRSRAPDDPNGIIRLIHLLVETGKMDEAIIQARRLRDSGLATPLLARELGDVLARQKLDAEAVRTYSEIVEFDPDSLPSRKLLGDIYLAHGWYDSAYRQYRTLTEAAPGESLFWLRLAAAAAGAGRVDEALRIERKVARATGRPGPDDPRRFARLWSAARLARMLAHPPESGSERLRESLISRLKELQLFRGQGSLVLLSWEDLSTDVMLDTLEGEKPAAVGERTDAATVGMSAVLLSAGDRAKVDFEARLRGPARRQALKLQRHDISWDGKEFKVELAEQVLPAGQTRISL
ncbi:MAG: tetratricopeptide repeat protein [Deltaproteobacteria bacterium]|nr:tetratricopeptide repeat protein [Deltaproteobacteria bacterium]